MKRISLLFATLLAGSTCSFAQQWEVGGSAGAAFARGLAVTSPAGTATAGYQPGAVFGGFFGQNLYKHMSGEVHYGFLQSNMRIRSGGSEATFSGVSHAIHYDLVLHTSRRGDARAQAFAAFGGGMRLFRGTGQEAAYQPLSQYAIFTKTQSVKPMASVGGGVKFALARNVYLRAEVRDYLSSFPKQVFTPAPGAKIGTLLHTVVPMVGISFTF
jgi:hypothetical protein